MKFIHQFRIIIIALISFLVITSGVFLRKTISIFLCGILSFNSASCYSFFDTFNAEAAPPPSSTKGAVVYVWNYRGSNEAWGHVSIMLNDPEKTYISWWPGPEEERIYKLNSLPKLYTVDANENQTFKDDKCLEGSDDEMIIKKCLKGNYSKLQKQPDRKIIIPCLDEKKIKIWWEGFKNTHQWSTWTQNCSTTVKDALYAGGAADILTMSNNLDWKTTSPVVPWYPNLIGKLATTLAKDCKETQCKLQNKDQNQPECQLTQGISTGDPHLGTFDGLRYDLQTVGEFILVKSNDGEFEVQARQTPLKNSTSISLNSAVAMKAGSDRVAFYGQGFPDADTSTPLRVNGKSTTIQGNKLALEGGGEILKQGNTYFINFPTGEKAVVTNNDGFLNISPSVYKQYGQYSGLLGNVNGNPNDDQQIRDGGSVLKVQSTYGNLKNVLNRVGLRVPGVLDRGEQVYFEQLYKKFGNSWRVKQEESLFDYPPGKTTENYVDPAFPDQYLKLDMLSADQIQKARSACTEAKVTQDLMEGCIFDVGFSGLSKFARATAKIQGYIDFANRFGIRIPKNPIQNQIQKIGNPIQNGIRKILPIPRCLPIIGCH